MKCPVCNGQKHYKNVFGKDSMCQYCLGTGEIEEKKPTNFSRITASPEALAEFIAEDRKMCHLAHCNVACEGCTKEGVLKWLKEIE